MKERFAFGKNWSNYVRHLNDDRINEAIKSLQTRLDVTRLDGKVFLDIGSGSGLFSLAAFKLGATVHSFDYDLDSVQCTASLKQRFAPNDPRWTVEQGSVLDKEFLQKFSKVDIVYSWGVLHHTGNMYAAFANVAELVKDNGQLFISIYNDQGFTSKIWKVIKKIYNQTPAILKFLIILLASFRLWGPTFIKDTIKHANPLKSWIAYGRNRGMSAYHDIVDWVGGYPFEVATPEQVFEFFYKKYGFMLQKLKTCAGGIGCNEFVFKLQSN